MVASKDSTNVAAMLRTNTYLRDLVSSFTKPFTMYTVYFTYTLFTVHIFARTAILTPAMTEHFARAVETGLKQRITLEGLGAGVHCVSNLGIPTTGFASFLQFLRKLNIIEFLTSSCLLKERLTTTNVYVF